MTEIGVRELKQHASAVLKRVESGETIVVTRNGRPVARLIRAGIPDDIAAMMERGVVRWSGRMPQLPTPVTPTPGGPSLNAIIDEERGPR